MLKDESQQSIASFCDELQLSSPNAVDALVIISIRPLIASSALLRPGVGEAGGRARHRGLCGLRVRSGEAYQFDWSHPSPRTHCLHSEGGLEKGQVGARLGH
jgi:hypothetical protein